MKKLLIICGPTASGKTALAVKLARQFKGEIISADSRQVYKGMDVGTGKDKEIYQANKIPVWGIDLVKPDERFSVAHWLELASQAGKDIWRRKKLALVVGGTGFWIKALIRGLDSLGIPPEWSLREKLENLEIKELQVKLKKLAPQRFKKMTASDKNNARRLIRAIEIVFKKKKRRIKIDPLKAERLLIIGLKAPLKFLYQQIDQRVEKRIKLGVQKEVEGLIKKGYSWNLVSMSASGYKEWQDFFKGEIGLREVISRWQNHEHGYARRQMTWFKKDKKIKWFDISQSGWQNDVVKLVESWYYFNNGKN